MAVKRAAAANLMKLALTRLHDTLFDEVQVPLLYNGLQHDSMRDDFAIKLVFRFDIKTGRTWAEYKETKQTCTSK